MTLKYDHLLDLPWRHAENDCFQLFRRFYADNFGVQIRPYAYPENWWNVAPEEDFFTRLARREGFVPVQSEGVTSMMPGYGLAISMGVNFASHCGVWIGNGQFLHQPRGENSRVERWVGRWASRTLSVWRHPQAGLPETVSRVDLIDLLPQHKRDRYRAILASRSV